MSRIGTMRTPTSKPVKPRSGGNGISTPNPFDSDSDSDLNQTSKPMRASSAPEISKANPKTSNPFDYGEDEGRGASSSSSYVVSSAARNQYKNNFRDSGGLEGQSVQELENYAVYRAEETTEKFNGCMKIAEEIREDATRTLVVLHQQGEQITRTHVTAANIDYDLSRGEKLLGSLGGLFSKTWKPKKTRAITGPVYTRDDPSKRRGNHLEQRERLGLTQSSRRQSNSHEHLPAPTSTLERVEVEKVKQDDVLSDLSNLLGELKNMAVDMGSEIERQNTDLDHLHDDVEVLNIRVDEANKRGRHLLRR
eukprot:TRINITY_DN4709_c2_g2_i1.p1 TRINITY_DN4709_c2_g2~~TRINITY_DN4709_c2_g2_i1.p1  ORF type:complete len:308 (-),score=53.15 TRINITY_DN4709_c2_g2_i1:84-1007(-)